MATQSRRRVEAVWAIRNILQTHFHLDHPQAVIDVYRYNSACVRIRIIDPSFAGMEIQDREQMVWPILERLPDEIVGQISVLLTIPPEERDDWSLSRDFDERRTERG